MIVANQGKENCSDSEYFENKANMIDQLFAHEQ